MVITAREEAQKERDIVQRRNDQLKAQLVDMERLLEWNQEQRKNIEGISTGASMTTPVTAVVKRLSAD
jgi:Rab guanine nucleotide exchange factor SEC2